MLLWSCFCSAWSIWVKISGFDTTARNPHNPPGLSQHNETRSDGYGWVAEMFLQPTVHLQEATTTTVHLYCFLFRHLLSFLTMPLTKTKIQFLIFLIHGEWIMSNILHINLICVIYFVFWSVFCFYLESFQLQCHPQTITAHIGGEFVILCKYDTNLFLFSKKYWCQGESKFTCEILVDSDNHVRSKTGRVYVVDLRKRGLFVKVTGLRFEDTGKYWVGIDKIHADIMTPIKVVISEGENKTSQFSIILYLWSALQKTWWMCLCASSSV